ncbi:MAG: FKBP-type peptidyl-prolyl cis-trans isomerase [Ferruginibacter sp.]
MKKIIYVSVICALAMSACTTPFKKAKDGSEYKVISDGKGVKAGLGNYLELNVVAKYKDSVLFNTREEGMPQYGPYDTTNMPSPFKEAFRELHVGDSIIIRVSTDSILSKGQAAPFIKKGQYIYQMYKLLNIYSTKEQMDSAQKTHMKVAMEKAYQKQLALVEKDLATNKAKIESDSKIIETYLSKNNIKATKTKWGTYVSIEAEGTGAQLTSKDVATVNYSGHVLDSTNLFDSNIDPKFKHTQPYDVSLGQIGGVILGWTDALMQLKNGSKAKVFIPSSLGYGKQGREPGISPDQILVFDIEVVNALSEEAKQAKQVEQDKLNQAAQQKMMDSIRNANPKIKAELEAKEKK